MTQFQKGDVVQHQILGTDKVVVGVGNDRYLCVHIEDISAEGQIRPNARVAIHRATNLQKVGRRENVAEVNLNNLYGRELVARHTFTPHWFKEEFISQGLFLLACLLIIFALISGFLLIRKDIHLAIDRKIESIKTQLYQEHQQNRK